MTYPIRTFPYATIVNVVDGDTCDVEVDLGFSVRVKHRFRLAGINTPERGKPGFIEASDFLNKYVLKAAVINVTKLDKYGRYLVEIFVDGVNINQELLNAGLATPYI